jgi:hypothetical protein
MLYQLASHYLVEKQPPGTTSRFNSSILTSLDVINQDAFFAFHEHSFSLKCYDAGIGTLVSRPILNMCSVGELTLNQPIILVLQLFLLFPDGRRGPLPNVSLVSPTGTYTVLNTNLAQDGKNDRDVLVPKLDLNPA